LDLTYAYDGFSARRVLELDRRLCAVSDVVCPVSTRIGNYLVDKAGCDPRRIELLPNATLSRNLQPSASVEPADLPVDVQDMKRPIAGVIGNMGDNIDWILLRDTIASTKDLSWVFVGPADTKISDVSQNRARQAVMSIGGRVRFLGSRPYEKLQSYARAFDVAILPYRRKEPTYSGSATRYYEHLAAGRPMLATRNVAELHSKEPMLKLVNTADELTEALTRLQASGFRDGLEARRIQASRFETWDARAKTMLKALSYRCGTVSLAV
jgi:glycosyltransferase involved in cell wall biosynthesis